jgi:hypothetical protein
LKIAPEHTEKGPLDLMMKPGMGTYDRFKEMFQKYSEEAGKKQYLIPYFISAHPGTEDEDMLNLALWLKKNNFECDQVQNFYPSPMCNATSMYYSETNPLKRVKYKKREDVPVAKGERQRRLHKALLRYHDPANWPMIREALINMGKKHLIGDKVNCLVPEEDIDTQTPAQRRKSGRHGSQRFATKHTKSQPGFEKTNGGNGSRNGKPSKGGNAGSNNSNGNKTKSGGGNSKPGSRGGNKPGGNSNRPGKPSSGTARPPAGRKPKRR